MTITKEQVISSLQELPGSFEPERISALQKLEEGLEQIKRGEAVTVAEAKSRLSKWRS